MDAFQQCHADSESASCDDGQTMLAFLNGHGHGAPVCTLGQAHERDA